MASYTDDFVPLALQLCFTFLSRLDSEAGLTWTVRLGTLCKAINQHFSERDCVELRRKYDEFYEEEAQKNDALMQEMLPYYNYFRLQHFRVQGIAGPVPRLQNA